MTKEIDYIKERVDRIEDKVDQLIDFRAKALGFIIASSSIIGFVVNIIFKESK